MSVMHLEVSCTTVCSVKTSCAATRKRLLSKTAAVSSKVHVKDVCSLTLALFHWILTIQQYMSHYCVLKMGLNCISV